MDRVDLLSPELEVLVELCSHAPVQLFVLSLDSKHVVVVHLVDDHIAAQLEVLFNLDQFLAESGCLVVLPIEDYL